MRIVHINNVAGIAKTIAQYQESKGHDVTVYAIHYNDNPMNQSLTGDINTQYNKKKPIKSIINIALTLLKLTLPAEIIHLHYPDHIFVNPAIIFWKILGKKIIVHYHGSDIRNKKSRWTIPLFAKTIYVSTPDLLSYSPKKAVWMPNPYKIKELDRPVDVKAKDVEMLGAVRILHAPSNKIVKGTDYIIQAVNELISDGYNIKFILLHNVSHEEVIEEIKKSDIVIDQLLLGWYGVFAMEGFEYAKPVCVYISDELKCRIPNEAYMNSKKETLKTNLVSLISNSSLRHNIGVSGRKYLEETHNIQKIGPKIMQDYK